MSQICSGLGRHADTKSSDAWHEAKHRGYTEQLARAAAGREQSLRAVGNTKTRADLASIDHLLEQMQATVYENYDQGYTGYSTGTNNPRSAHVPGTGSTPLQQLQQPHHGSVASSADSTTQVTPAPTNDDFNFESMFGEPSADHGVPDNEINFDLNLADDFAANLEASNDANQNPSDLNSLLPGLE